MTPVTFIGAVDAVSQHYDIMPAGLQAVQGTQSVQGTEQLQSAEGLQNIEGGN